MYNLITGSLDKNLGPYFLLPELKFGLSPKIHCQNCFKSQGAFVSFSSTCF